MSDEKDDKPEPKVPPGVPIDDYFTRQMMNPEFKREFDKLPTYRPVLYRGREVEFIGFDESSKFSPETYEEINRLLQERGEEYRRRVMGNFYGVDIGNGPDSIGLLGQPGALPISTHTAPTPQPTGDEILKSITDAFDQLKQHPICFAIWFVDVPLADEAKFRIMLGRSLPATGPRDGLFSLPFKYWNSEQSTEDERMYMSKAGLTFYFQPGIWAEMSDGKHWRIEL